MASAESNDTITNDKVPVILDGKFFDIVQVNGDKVNARCTLCKPSKSLSGLLSATSNFLIHLKRIHPDRVKEFEKHKIDVCASKRLDRNIDSVEPRKKQQKIDFCHAWMSGVPQNKVDELVMNYIVNGLCSLRTVETPSFRNLIKGLRPGAAVMSRATLTKRLKEKSEKMRLNVKERLSSVQFVCTTADAWSTTGRSFLGVTAHWISAETLKRQSVALACKRLLGPHSYDVIAEALQDTFNDYDLTPRNNKLICCVTDNGSNFLKAFREFGFEQEKVADSTFVDDDEDVESNSENLHFDNLECFLTIANNAASDLTSDVILPKHHPCSSHTLSLIAVSDSKRALNENLHFKRLHNSTMAKCFALWNVVSRSTKASETVEGMLGRRLVRPCETRWNSLFDSLQVLQSLRGELKNVCQAVGVAAFKDVELDFIEEYTAVLSPIASAIDLLQGEKMEHFSYMGALLPTLLTVKQKLCAMEGSIHASQLVKALLDGLEKRFTHVMDFGVESSDYIIASVSHPFFKLRWIPADQVDKCRLLFTRTRVSLSTDKSGSATTTSSTPITEVSTSSSHEEFFSFTASQTVLTQTQQQNKIQLEFAHYLEDPSTELMMLQKYPYVKTVFMMFNTAIPSSAPVERLFSFGGMIHSNKRNRLSDTVFETLLLLKANDCENSNTLD